MIVWGDTNANCCSPTGLPDCLKFSIRFLLKYSNCLPLSTSAQQCLDWNQPPSFFTMRRQVMSFFLIVIRHKIRKMFAKHKSHLHNNNYNKGMINKKKMNKCQGTWRAQPSWVWGDQNKKKDINRSFIKSLRISETLVLNKCVESDDYYTKSCTVRKGINMNHGLKSEDFASYLSLGNCIWCQWDNRPDSFPWLNILRFLREWASNFIFICGIIQM